MPKIKPSVFGAESQGRVLPVGGGYSTLFGWRVSRRYPAWERIGDWALAIGT
jgi:hypothetical protein